MTTMARNSFEVAVPADQEAITGYDPEEAGSFRFRVFMKQLLVGAMKSAIRDRRNFAV